MLLQSNHLRQSLSHHLYLQQNHMHQHPIITCSKNYHLYMCQRLSITIEPSPVPITKPSHVPTIEPSIPAIEPPLALATEPPHVAAADSHMQQQIISYICANNRKSTCHMYQQPNLNMHIRPNRYLYQQPNYNIHL